MTEVRYWIAEDGEKFDDEEECIEYEYNLQYKALNGTCACFNTKLERVEAIGKFEEAVFVALRSQKAVTWWLSYSDYLGYGVEGINGPGEYFYNGDSYKWELVQEKIDYFNNIKEKMREN